MNQHIEKERYDMNDFRKRSGQPKKSGAAAKRGQGKNGRTASANGFSSPRKSSGAASPKPYYQTKLQGRTGAQPGDYVIISDGKQEITTRVNLASHPFCKKKVGDRVAEGDVLCKIETDKAVTDVESTVNGTLCEIVAQEGDTVEITKTIAWVEVDG